MKKNYLFYLLVITILTSSCASLKVNTVTPYRGDNVKKLAIIGSYIGRVKQPKLPLIDASAFNKRTNKIGDEVMSYQEEILPKIEDRLAEGLGNSLNVEIIKPSSFTEEQITAINEKYNRRSRLGIDHKHYNKLITTSEDINIFAFNNGKVLEHFKLPANYMREIREVCSILDVDGVIVNYHLMNVVGVGAFGTSGTLRLDSYVYIFDSNARVIAKSSAFTKPMGIKGKKIGDYELVYDQYPIITDLISTDIIKPKSSK